jgi:hypothetical protein
MYTKYTENATRGMCMPGEFVRWSDEFLGYAAGVGMRGKQA